MEALHFRVRTKAPVIISTIGGDTSLTPTHDYLPGTSILGAFVSRYVLLTKQRGADTAALHLDDTFFRWCLSGSLSFGNAYLVARGEYKEYELLPTPLSLEQERDSKTVYNLLSADGPLDVKTDPVGAFCAFEGSHLIVEAPEKELHFHHTRADRLRGRSTEGELFSFEALSAGQVFAGQILGEQQELEKLKAFFGNRFQASLGRSRSAQYGQVEMELGAIETAGTAAQAWNDLSGEKEVVIQLTSPAILRNELGFPDASVETFRKYLAEALGSEQFDIEQCFARTETVENYVAVWKLKRPADHALTAGSTFLLSFSEPIGTKLVERLKQLLERGIGERRKEGFGRLMLLPELEPSYTLMSLNGPKPLKPDYPVPPEAVRVFSAIIESHLVQQIEQDGVAYANELFNDSQHKLPNSLLGRLEMLLKQDPEGFSPRIRDLRSTAQENLLKYKSRGASLFHELADEQNSKHPNWTDFYNRINQQELTRLAALIDLKIDDNPELKAKLYQAYWLAFLRQTRILNRREARVG